MPNRPPQKREIQRGSPAPSYRGRYPPPPGRLEMGRSRQQRYTPRRGRAEAIELPPTLWDRLSDPNYVGRTIPYVGIATLLVSTAFLLIYWGDVVGGLLIPVFIAGSVGVVLTTAGSLLAMFKGNEDDLDRAYLGLGLSIASFIMLGSGAVLSWF
jgi:hypothetical protein